MPSLVPPVVASGALGRGVQPVLSFGDLRLRPWQTSDAPALLDVYADPAVQQWHGEYLDEAEASAYAQTWAGYWRSGQRVGWAVERDDGLVGRVTLTRIVLETGQAEVTYWVIPAARGAGVAPRAVDAVATWAFTRGFNRLELAHSTRNPSSCRVAEKTGFALEGTRRRALQHLDGWHDMHLHARVRPD